MRHWLLPEYIEDVLPGEAYRIELVRRRLLDLFHSCGYQFVIPPLLEYVESLNTGIGRDLDLLTFKVVDQLSGKLMGVRPDITPQAARIDAHLLNRQGVTRLCYAGSVLRTQPGGTAQTRQPLQIGAELFGHAGIESDLEIQQLLVRSLITAGINKPHLDFSHAAIFRALVKHGDVCAELESVLFEALQAKDVTLLHEMTSKLDEPVRKALRALPELYGDSGMLREARMRLPELAEISQALTELERVAQFLNGSGAVVTFDLAELRGYHYHNGLVFAAYAEGHAGALALGGRYDQVGQAFGRARPATGFSLDMRALIGMLPCQTEAAGILAPFMEDSELQSTIEALRAEGEVVIVKFPGQEHCNELGCDRVLVKQGEGWAVVPAE